MKPITTKDTSTIIRITPKFFFNLSARTIETKSLGPVPASDFITMVIPKAKITHPKPFTIILTAKELTSWFKENRANNTNQNYATQYETVQIIFEVGKIMEYSKIEKQ